MMITKVAGGGEGRGEGEWDATPARQSSCRDTIQKSFYVSSACLAAWHFLALLPSDGENVEKERERVGGGGKGETTAACNAWLRCLPSQQVAREEERGSGRELAISFRRAAKTHETENFCEKR